MKTLVEVDPRWWVQLCHFLVGRPGKAIRTHDIPYKQIFSDYITISGVHPMYRGPG